MGVTAVDNTISLWGGLARAAGLVAFGVLLSFLAVGASTGELLVSAVLGLGAFGIAQTRLFNNPIYVGQRRPLRAVELGLVGLSVLAYTCVSISILRSDSGLWWTRPFAICSISLMAISLVIGLALHRKGAFGGFACDLCQEAIVFRRGQNECYITGPRPM